MRRILIGVMSVGLMIGATACNSGGVDKQGTADNLVKSLEQTLGTTVTATQKTCLTDLVKSYSAADLKTIDSQASSTTPSPLVDEFRTKALTCLGAAGATDTTGADSATTDAGTTPAT